MRKHTITNAGRKVAIVTGSSRGIGKAIAYELAKNNYNVVINSTRQGDSDDIVKNLKNEFGIDAIGISADIRNQAQVKKMIEDAIKKFGKIDALVNNAGVLLVKDLEETSEREWDYVLDTNLKGVFLCSKEAIPYMREGGKGSIINISSGAGKSGYSEIAAYCASKFGVIGLTESLAKEVAKDKITVIAICPGAVATDMQKQFMGSIEYEKQKNKMIQPEEVARKVLDAINGKYPSGSAIDVY